MTTFVHMSTDKGSSFICDMRLRFKLHFVYRLRRVVGKHSSPCIKQYNKRSFTSDFQYNHLLS